MKYNPHVVPLVFCVLASLFFAWLVSLSACAFNSFCLLVSVFFSACNFVNAVLWCKL